MTPLEGLRATGRLPRRAAAAVSVEWIVGMAIVLTILAVAYREPLTRQTLQFTPQQAGKSFYGYAYTDAGNGGTSAVSTDPRNPINWTCTLGAGFDWPYCGFGLLFDRNHDGRGIDLRGFERISLRLAYHGSGKLIRISLKDHDRRYAALPNGTDKVNQASFPIRSGVQTVPLTLADFGVAEWWKNQTKAPAQLAHPSFGNIVAMELITGDDGELGPQQLRIDNITFERHFISTEAWYGAIALFWMGLIGSVLLYRRRQVAEIRRQSELALRESERLHRGILEASTDVIVLLDRDGAVVLVNAPGLAAMELESADRVLGKHWTRLWRDESAAVVAGALGTAAGGETARFRAFCATSKGTPKWWDVVVAPMCDDEGSLTGILTISRDVTTEREKSDQLQWASEHDPLTHLPNRRAFQARLQAAILRAMETGAQIGLLLIDLDHFKHVNDTLGHGAGDDLLKAIGKRIRNSIREGDFVARIGGDEFAIIVEQVDSDQVLAGIGNHVVSTLQAPLRIAGRAVGASASIGGALFPKNAATANDLFKSADMALYALKEEGRGGTRLFNPQMLHDAEKSASQLRLARGSVNEKTVVPVYQPKVHLDGGRIGGLEALLRWRHPRNGLQLPGTLEEAFSDYELAAKIGDLMQRRVARDARQWLDAGLDFGRVAINASPAEFLRDDYAEHLLSVLAKDDIPAGCIEIEITEHAFLGRATEYVGRALTVLKQAGISVSLDDFGTGASSLSHLRDFPVDVVKIDKSFVKQMTDDPEIAAIVTAVVRLACSLSIGVVAEGVETPVQLDLLRAMGCHMAQGHLFAAAVEASDVPALLPGKRAAA